MDFLMQYTMPKKVVFASIQIYAGNLKGLAVNGLTGADAKCQARADAAGLGGTGVDGRPRLYKAWLSSTTVSAASRLTHFGGLYTNPNNGVVAHGWADLTDGSLDLALNLDESGAITVGTAYV